MISVAFSSLRPVTITICEPFSWSSFRQSQAIYRIINSVMARPVALSTATFLCCRVVGIDSRIMGFVAPACSLVGL